MNIYHLSFENLVCHFGITKEQMFCFINKVISLNSVIQTVKAILFNMKKICRLHQSSSKLLQMYNRILLTVKAATLIFISGRGSAISSAKEGKSGFIYNLVKS